MSCERTFDSPEGRRIWSARARHVVLQSRLCVDRRRVDKQCVECPTFLKQAHS
jgi:hypothetical protein